MPYRIRWEGHGVYRRFYGVTTAEDFIQADEEMTQDLRYPRMRYVISDYLDIEAAPEFKEAHLQWFAGREKLYQQDSPDIVRASIATNENILQYLQTYETRELAPYPFAIFSNVAEAREWIAKNPRPGWRNGR